MSNDDDVDCVRTFKDRNAAPTVATPTISITRKRNTTPVCQQVFLTNTRIEHSLNSQISISGGTTLTIEKHFSQYFASIAAVAITSSIEFRHQSSVRSIS